MGSNQRSPHPERRREANPPDPRPARLQYFTGPGRINEELLDKEAEELAKKLKDVKTSQLRRFYEDVLGIKRRLEHEAANRPGETRESVFERLRPEFKMLRAKAYYANKRSRQMFPDELREFFDRHVRAVEQCGDFLVFVKHFQAVVAFHKFYGKD